MNPNLPLADVRTVQELYERSMARTSFAMTILAIAAGMALLLGVVGIYGVLSYAVSQRTREIGIRMALGAGQPEVRGMFVRYGLTLTGIGVALRTRGIVRADAVDVGTAVRGEAGRPCDIRRGRGGAAGGGSSGELRPGASRDLDRARGGVARGLMWGRLQPAADFSPPSQTQTVPQKAG